MVAFVQTPDGSEPTWHPWAEFSMVCEPGWPERAETLLDERFSGRSFPDSTLEKLKTEVSRAIRREIARLAGGSLPRTLTVVVQIMSSDPDRMEAGAVRSTPQGQAECWGFFLTGSSPPETETGGEAVRAVLGVFLYQEGDPQPPGVC